MRHRTWPYGTQKRITIKRVEKSARHRTVVCHHRDDEREATLCVMIFADFNAIRPAPEVGQNRLMEFRRGGPTGGHWAILDGIEQQPAGADAPATGE